MIPWRKPHPSCTCSRTLLPLSSTNSYLLYIFISAGGTWHCVNVLSFIPFTRTYLSLTFTAPVDPLLCSSNTSPLLMESSDQSLSQSRSSCPLLSLLASMYASGHSHQTPVANSPRTSQLLHAELTPRLSCLLWWDFRNPHLEMLGGK